MGAVHQHHRQSVGTRDHLLTHPHRATRQHRLGRHGPPCARSGGDTEVEIGGVDVERPGTELPVDRRTPGDRRRHDQHGGTTRRRRSAEAYGPTGDRRDTEDVLGLVVAQLDGVERRQTEQLQEPDRRVDVGGADDDLGRPDQRPTDRRRRPLGCPCAQLSGVQASTPNSTVES